MWINAESNYIGMTVRWQALTGPDYSTLCGGMSCYSPESNTCSSILPLDGTICGNFTVGTIVRNVLFISLRFISVYHSF